MGYLSPVARRRIALLVLLAGAAVAALAITNTGPFSNPTTQEDRARSALEGFFDAARQGHFHEACALLAGQRQGCAKVLPVVGRQLSGTTLEVQDVRVSGNLAAIDTKLRVPGRNRVQLRTFKLEERGGRWLISDLGS
jgi:hypothetical protein